MVNGTYMFTLPHVLNFLTGIVHESDGGAIMLETYSNATITDCSFINNQASYNGGAICSRRISQLIIRDSYLWANNVCNSGGSILVEYSLLIIKSSTFENDISAKGYGGSIAAEHVGNVTIDNCLFINCTAANGGSVSVRAESVVITNNSHFDNSFSNSSGGGLYISKSILRSFNVVIRNSRSSSGAGIFVSDLSEITMKEFQLVMNKAEKSGGTIYCNESKMVFEEGKVEINYAKSVGGAMFSEHCQITFDSVTFVNNTAEISGGAIYSESSMVDIHNCKSEDNSATGNGKFAMISKKSKLKANYLTVIDIKRNSVVINESSSAELRHVHLANGSYYCSISAFMDSNIYLVTIYSQEIITDEEYVCPDKTSSVKGTPTGVFLIIYFTIFLYYQYIV